MAASSLAAALVGGAIARIIPLEYVRYGAGVLFIIFGVLILLRKF